MWCSVCGWDFDESFEKGYEYGEGDICECCGTEFGCDEDMYKEDVLQEYCNNDINILKKIAPEIALMDDEDVIPYEVAISCPNRSPANIYLISSAVSPDLSSSVCAVSFCI